MVYLDVGVVARDVRDAPLPVVGRGVDVKVLNLPPGTFVLK
jgi:hypothetical protein